MRSIGLDLGVKKIAFCEVLDGKVIRRCEVKSVDDLAKFLGPNVGGPAVVAFEACRTAWHVHATLKGWGHEPKMVDTTRVRQLGIGSHGRKTDTIDAEHLARAVEAGRIPVAHVLSEARQVMRHEMFVRRHLVEARTAAIVTIRGQLTAEGLRLPVCDSDMFLSKLREHALPVETRARIAPIVAVLTTVEGELVAVDRALEKRCEKDETIMRLATAPGVGFVLACTFVSVIDDARRFNSAGQVRSFLGLVPAENSSGDRRSLGHITRAGNSYARTLLAQAAHVILSKGSAAKHAEDALVIWAQSLLARIGRPKTVIAVARKLAGVLWAIWTKGTAYDPVRAAEASARGVAMDATARAGLAEKLDNAKKKLRQRATKTNARARRLEKLTDPVPTASSNAAARDVPMRRAR